MKTALGLLLIGSVLVAGCSLQPGQAQPQPQTDPETPAAAGPVPKPQPAVPQRPFPADGFYDLLVAEFAIHRGEYELALNNYLQQAHTIGDIGVTARASRLAQFVQSDRAALDAAQLWAMQDPDDIEAQFTLATQLAKAQRPLEAMPHMVKVLDSGSNANFAVIAAAALQQSEGTQTTLLAQFESLLATHKDSVELMTGKALLLQERGQREEALALVRKVLEIAPDTTHAIVIEAKLLEDMGRQQEAVDRLQQMVEQNPYNRRLRLQYARLLTRQDMTKAREQFGILVEQSPGDADILLSLALVTKETGALDDAESYFEQLLTLGQHAQEANFYLGQIAEQRGDIDTALRHYEQIPPSPDFFPALGRIVQLQMAKGQVAALRRQLGDLRQRYPQHAVRLYLVEADILLQEKDYQAGNELLTAALKKFPQQPNLLYSRSTFSEKRRDMALVEKDLRAILAQDADNIVALNSLGYTLCNLTNRYEEAYELIKRALAQKPDDPAIQDSMGWVEYRRGNLTEARAYLEKSYAVFPDPEVAAHLGEVLWQAGSEQRAREIWAKALAEEPESEHLLEALKRLAPDLLPATKP